jgi:hypothetical protein
MHPLCVVITHGGPLLIVKVYRYVRTTISSVSVMAIVRIVIMIHPAAIATLMSIILLVFLALTAAGMVRFLGKYRAVGQQADDDERH